MFINRLKIIKTITKSIYLFIFLFKFLPRLLFRILTSLFLLNFKIKNFWLNFLGLVLWLLFCFLLFYLVFLCSWTFFEYQQFKTWSPTIIKHSKSFFGLWPAFNYSRSFFCTITTFIISNNSWKNLMFIFKNEFFLCPVGYLFYSITIALQEVLFKAK